MYSEYSVLIVDDEPLICETIKVYLEEIKISNIETVNSKIEVEELLLFKKFDLILLDIRMKGKLDGIEIGLLLNSLDIPFIYITAHSDLEMANKMVETNAKGYISKPIRKNELFVNVSLVLKAINSSKKQDVTITNGNQIQNISNNKILFIKSTGNYLEIYSENNIKILVRNTFEKILAELNSVNFKQCHRSYIVNTIQIEQITFSEILLKSKQQIPLSRSFVDSFRSVKK